MSAIRRLSPARLAQLDARLSARVASGDYERLEWALGDSSGVLHRGATGPASLYRIYSMTKPLVSVAALQLIEEGRLQLFHPVARYLPEFAEPMVFTAEGPRPAARPMLVHHLMTHMSGLSYGFMPDESGRMMNAANVHDDAGVPLRDDVRKIAAIPLQFEPGARWLYSVATDVLAALIEVIEGAPLGEILRARVTGPLGMEATSFHPGARAAARIPPILGGANGGLISSAELARAYPLDDPGFARGGHGLFSTLEDYAIFARALLCGARGKGEPALLSPATLGHATANHAAGVMPLHIELPPGSVNPGMDGQGFGLGFAVSRPGGPLTSRPGAFGWSGAAETWFTVDPKSDLFVVQMAQNFDWPGACFDLQNMAYGALMD
ncbi:MAG: serine hydrolase domain-containing protein [Paracoccaceae bacterium]